MAETDSSDTKTTKSKGSRVQWTEGETRTLIQAWEDNIGDLRRQKRNAGVYDTMVLHLGRLDIMRSRKQVVTKIENLVQMYRQVFFAAPFSQRLVCFSLVRACRSKLPFPVLSIVSNAAERQS